MVVCAGPLLVLCIYLSALDVLLAGCHLSTSLGQSSPQLNSLSLQQLHLQGCHLASRCVTKWQIVLTPPGKALPRRNISRESHITACEL